MLTKDELLSRRQYACDVGRNAGNSVGEMVNAVLSTERTTAEKLKRLEECARVANGEMSELRAIIRECRECVDPNTKVSDGRGGHSLNRLVSALAQDVPTGPKPSK
jgi:hypothetical protein